MKVSVIIPVFNCEKYLNQCFECLVNQTFKDFEVIFINDGSTDDSKKICLECAEKDPRFKVISKEVSEGAGPARNSGIDAAQGEYFMFIDADDRISSDMIERMVSEITAKQTDVVICGYETYVEGVGELNNEVFKYNAQIINDKKEIHTLFADYFPEGFVGYLWNKIYRAETIKKNKLRFPSMRRLQDGVFNVMFFDVADSCAVIEDVLYFYRINAQNDMFRKCPPDYFDLIKQFTETYIETKEKWGNFSNEKINIFFLNETGTCIENTLSPQWNMSCAKRREYCKMLAKDELLHDAFNSGVSIGRYRFLLISLIMNRHCFTAACLIKVKVFAKTILRRMFYFLKRVGKNA